MKGRLFAAVAKWGAAVLFVAVPARALADTPYWPPLVGTRYHCSNKGENCCSKEGEACPAVARMITVRGRCVKRVGTAAGQKQPVEKLECVPLSQLQDKAQPASAKGKRTRGKLGDTGVPAEPRAAPAQDKPEPAPVQDSSQAAPVPGKPAAAPAQQRPQAPPAEQPPAAPPAQGRPPAAEHVSPVAQTEPNGCSVGAGTPCRTLWVAGLVLLLVGLRRSASRSRGEKSPRRQMGPTVMA